MAEREKFKLSNVILKGQQDLLRILTNFLHPNATEQDFNKRLIKAIENSVPDKFCYKNSGLAEKQKLSCPAAFPESKLGLCVETCEQGQALRNI